MAILKRFNETSQEIENVDIKIDETNFQEYIDQYNIDRAEGYLDAFHDIMKQVTGILTRTDKFGDWGVSSQVAGTGIKRFHKKNSLTLETILKQLSDSKLKP